MNKNGFTLIETVVSMFILSILFSVGLTLSNFGNNLSADIKNTDHVYEIQNLLSYGKAVCSEKNKYGKITIKSNNNEIRFIEGADKADKIEKIINLPSDIKIISNDISVFITPYGKIERGFTINLVDKYGRRQDIIVRVGVDLIIIPDGEFI